MDCEKLLISLAAIILLFVLLYFIYVSCIKCEKFTAPGLTLTMPPSWFPQNAARKYNPNDWKSRMYLDRYPFYDAVTKNYISDKESNYLANATRYWEF